MSSPKAPASDRDFYPDALKSRDWWVNWVLAVRHEELSNGTIAADATPTKQPVAPYDTGDAEPTEWNQTLSEEEHPRTSFEEAAKWNGWAVGGGDLPAPDRVLSDELGVGIIMPVGGGDEEPIVLLDWDDVRDPETEEIHPECAEALDRLDGYAEISQSGEGIHQFVFGELPGGFKKFLRHIDDEPFVGDDKPMVEMYASGRLTAMTGRHVEGTGTDVVDGQELIDELCWRFGAGTNNSTDTPTDPFASERGSESEESRPSHEQVGQALRSEIEYDGDDPADWDVGVDETVKYAAVLRGRERSNELPNTANWELIGYAAAVGKDIGKSKSEVLADLKSHPTPQYGYDDARARKEVRSVWRKVEKGYVSPPNVETLKRRGLLPTDYVDLDELHTDGTLSPQQTWNEWASARKAGRLTEKSIVPTRALRHIAASKKNYPVEELPTDRDDLPPVPNNKALSWVKNEWPREAGLSLDDDEEVTIRSYKEYDPSDVHAWDDVRTIYDKMGKKEGRYAAVRLLRARHEFLTPTDTEELHVYDPERGVYDTDLRRDIGLTLDRELREHYSQQERREIRERLKEESVDRDDMEAGAFEGEFLCVANGVLDISKDTDRDLLPHDPKYKFTRRLPHEYDPEAACPNISEFLDDITKREEDKKTLLEMVGHAFLSHYEYPHALILFGQGSNGKSTWFDIVGELLGAENTTSIGLKTLSENRFASSRLVGKWANIGADLPSKKVHELGHFKNLTGDDSVFAERKGKDGFEFENRATMMFGANDPPVLGERNHAIQRRIVPVHLPYKFTSEDDEHKDEAPEGFKDSLKTSEELSGLLNAALDGLDRLRETGDVSLPESFEERLELYERHSDHIRAFGVDCVTNESGERIEKDWVYTAYTNYCEENGHEPVNRKTFFKNLRKTALDVSEVRPPERPDGTRPRMLDNATFTDIGTQYAPEYAVDEEGSDSEGPETALADVSAGDMTTVTAEVVQLYSDTKPWLATEGFLVDESPAGAVKVLVRDECDLELEEGTFYRFEDVTVRSEDAMRAVEIVPNLSTIEDIDPGEGTTKAESQQADFPPSVTDVDESSDETETAADGGTTAHARREGSQLKAEIETALRNSSRPLKIPEIAGRIDRHPQDVAETAGTMKQEGKIDKLPGEDGLTID